MRTLAEAGAALLGLPLVHVEGLRGGNLSEIVRITLSDGREAVVKTGPAPLTEATMLRAVAASGAPAPEVLAATEQTLVVQWVPNGGGLSEAWPDLGVQLAKLHAVNGPRYGWESDYAFGSVAITNGWCDDWPTFWAERRLRPALAHIASDLASRVAALAEDLPDRLPARPPPSLLHGDLWSGNVLAAGGAISGLIDPACYHGHAEVDLAMLTLFDRPAPTFFEAYDARESGREQRQPIYALWPALVHLRLFGEGYRALVDRLLARAGV